MSMWDQPKQLFAAQTTPNIYCLQINITFLLELTWLKVALQFKFDFKKAMNPIV